MSVEEGLTTVMTTGVATADADHETAGLSQARLRRLGELGYADLVSASEADESGKAEGDPVPTDEGNDGV